MEVPLITRGIRCTASMHPPAFPRAGQWEGSIAHTPLQSGAFAPVTNLFGVRARSEGVLSSKRAFVRFSPLLCLIRRLCRVRTRAQDASCVESKGVSEGRRRRWEQRSSAPLSSAPAASPAASSSSPSTTAAKQCSRGRRSEVDEGTVQLFGGERFERRTEQCQASPELRKVRPFCPLSRSATRSKKRRGGSNPAD